MPAARAGVLQVGGERRATGTRLAPLMKTLAPRYNLAHVGCLSRDKCRFSNEAVKARWLANGQQPLGGIQVPMQPTAPAGQFVQAPQ